MKTYQWLALPLAALFLATGCEERTKLVVTSCLGDKDCPEGYLCEEGVCVPESKFSCDNVPGGAGVLQPAPHVVDFGEVGSDPVSKEITLRNIGACSLTIFEAKLSGGATSPFTCAGCDDKAFPIEIFPMRERKVTVSFTAPKVGSFEDKLELLSDDAEFATLPVPVRARFAGVPKLVVSPDPVKFGYVAQGADASKVVQITNHGTGLATVGIKKVSVEPATNDAFSLADSIENPLPTADKPAVLSPTAVDARSALLVGVHYHPRGVEVSQADLVIETDSAAVGSVRVPLTGTSETPPELSLSPDFIDFKDVPLGQMMAQTLTLVNKGGSPLELSYKFRNNCPAANPKCSADFSFEPATLPTLEPGKYVEMKVFVTPTIADKINGLLIIDSNDPRRPSTTVSLSARGVNDGTQVVKVEVSYDNGDDGTFDNDLRRLEASLESPYGFICGKADPKPTNWGDFGTPSWMSLGAKMNPQRVILVNPKQDGTFKVLLQYTEDCSSLPSQLLSSVLGISVDLLISYYTGGVVNLDPNTISSTVDKICFSHSATTATVRVWVNGVTMLEKPATMSKKGEFLYAADIVRAGGQITAK